MTGTPLVEWNWAEVLVGCGGDCVPSVEARVWRETDIIRYARVRPASPEGVAIACRTVRTRAQEACPVHVIRRESLDQK